MSHKISYICPHTKEPLAVEEDGLRRSDGALIPYVLQSDKSPPPVPDFREIQGHGDAAKGALDTYDTDSAAEIYRNFLNWLFATFDQDEDTFRQILADKLELGPGARVLITGCGLGEDLPLFFERVGEAGELFVQDFSGSMVRAAIARLEKSHADELLAKISFSVGDASELPFMDNIFDAAFHFGGINLFADTRGAIGEMSRVVRPGGKVVFGDEGVAPWLRETEYGKAAILNNASWSYEVPLADLPESCEQVNVNWVLGNCFWVIDFVVSEDGPHMNMDVSHKGLRGGSIRTRYFGQLEGVTPETKVAVTDAAKADGVSIHEWLESTLRRAVEGPRD